jgi:hypothetical protein
LHGDQQQGVVAASVPSFLVAIMHALKYPGILENHFHLVFLPGSGVCQENTNYAG